MNTLGVFKLEVDPERPSQSHIDFKLVLNKQKKVPRGEGNDKKSSSSSQRVLVTVDARRVHIKKLSELD